jgi:adenosine deaminase
MPAQGSRPETIGFDDFLRLLPKVELHCHLAGTLRPATLMLLAKKHGVRLPRPMHELYVYKDFYDFIDILRQIALVLVHADDFALAIYEALQDGFESGKQRHAEIFFNPQYFYPNGTRYGTMLDGLIEGARAAEKDFGVSCLLIPSIDRQIDPAAAMEILDDILADRRPEVIGIGLDGPEREGPPRRFAGLYARAGAAGLRRTAHVCEDNQTLAEAPPSHYADCRDRLGCERLDHGYNLLAEPEMVRRARDEGVFFTTCSVTSVTRNLVRRQQSIARMVDNGLRVTVNTDDPQMFHTDLGDSYIRLFKSTGWDVERACTMSFNGIEASWLPDGAKRALRTLFENEIADFKRRLHARESKVDQ